MSFDLALRQFPLVDHSKIDGPKSLASLEEWESIAVPEWQLKNRAEIEKLRQAFEDMPRDMTDEAMTQLEPIHYFYENGVYVRELTMPAGFRIIGRRHSTEHLVLMKKGRCIVWTEHGMQEMTAPYFFWSPAGEKRVLYIIEETTWQTAHKSDVKDPELVKHDITFPEPHEMRLNISEEQNERP